MKLAADSKKDLVWTILATFFKLGAGVLLFPFILNKLPAQTIGIWTIFTSVGVISTLLDFGFNQSFARNVAYVFSGVKNLQKQGYQTLNEDNIPDELKYTRDHVWVQVEGDVAVIGVTDYAQEQLGDILFVTLPEADEDISAGDVFTELESSRTTLQAAAPVSGTIIF